jgi:SAM-dependent methyltransferase
MFKYARLRVFHYLLHPFQRRMRERRMRVFIEKAGLKKGMRVIDLGGSPGIWKFVPIPLDITMVNLEFSAGAEEEANNIKQHKFTFVVGDACSADFPTSSFDLAFSNSVIEHVGSREKRAEFAREVRRLAPRYWVQTPSKYFPIEAHTGMPFWWYYPEVVRRRLKRKWHEKLPAWTEMIEGTDIVEQQELEAIFPQAHILKERLMGIVKSYIAVRI